MRSKFRFPVLAVVLVLAWTSVAPAQQPGGALLEEDVAANLALLRTMAEKGDRDAQFRLGELYEEGEVLERDIGKAIEMYRRAAEQGHPQAQYALAHIYHLGDDVQQDMAAAIVWYRKAASQGDEWSQLALGNQYRIGLAVPRDLAQSAAWYRKAAEQGNSFAQYELGNAYRHGSGVERNISHAINWFGLSAEAGNPSAKLALIELEADPTGPKGVTAPPALKAPRDSDADRLADDSEADLLTSETASLEVGGEDPAIAPPEHEDAAQSAASTPASDAAVPGTEMTDLAEPSYSVEKEVLLLLTHAEDQAENLALTTPAGNNAYETYQQILSLQPKNEAALDGIEQIGVKYVELANLAAANGDLRKANHYARKAAVLAPEHPSVRSMTLPIQTDQPRPEEATLTSETVADVKTQQRVPAEPQEATNRVEVAAVTPGSTTLHDLVQDPDDLVFAPHNYQGRQVVVTGSVVHLLWDYRLKAETGQNSIVINVEGLSQADRSKLESAIEGAGFLGQVRARIGGRIERQTLATFELAATELALTKIDPSGGEIPNPSFYPDFDEAPPLVVPVYPGEPFGQTNINNNRYRSGDRDSTSATSSNGAGPGGASGGESSSAGSGGSGGGKGNSKGKGGKGNGKGRGKN